MASYIYGHGVPDAMWNANSLGNLGCARIQFVCLNTSISVQLLRCFSPTPLLMPCRCFHFQLLSNSKINRLRAYRRRSSSLEDTLHAAVNVAPIDKTIQSNTFRTTRRERTTNKYYYLIVNRWMVMPCVMPITIIRHPELKWKIKCDIIEV